MDPSRQTRFESSFDELKEACINIILKFTMHEYFVLFAGLFVVQKHPIRGRVRS